jgi:two-component system, NtrC family, response regulator PilR
VATLLIIDDDNQVRSTLRDLFSGTHECHTADRVEQALGYLEFETYDLVLTDISMPGLSGLDVLKHMCQRHPTTPVIVISGQPDADRNSLMALGAFDFCAKPFLLEDLEAAVTRAIVFRNDMKAGAQIPPLE